MDMFFLLWSDPRLYNRKPRPARDSACVETESNTSTVALRVVGGEEKGTQCLRLGSLESEAVNCGHESRGTRT
jgi:hypothetical protein